MIDYRARQQKRGYMPSYYQGCRCPSCGRSSWHVGRISAECAFCSTALPLAYEAA